MADSLWASICGYSVLLPGARILPHSEDANSAALRAHIGLRVPSKGGFGLRVDEHATCWSEGSLFLFDSTNVHEAWNFTDEIRVVLLLDFGASHLPQIAWPNWMHQAIAKQAFELQQAGAVCQPSPADCPPLSVVRLFPPGVAVKLGRAITLIEQNIIIPIGTRGIVQGVVHGFVCPPALVVSLDGSSSLCVSVPSEFLNKLPKDLQRFRARLSCSETGYSSPFVYVTCDIAPEGPCFDAWDEDTGAFHGKILIQGWTAFRSLALTNDRRISWQHGHAGEEWSLNFEMSEGAQQCWHLIHCPTAASQDL